MKIHIPQFETSIQQEQSSKRSLYEELIKNNIPIASSCKGKGICGKCAVFISTEEYLPKTELEQNTLDKNKITHQRLSCMVHPQKACKVSTLYW